MDEPVELTILMPCLNEAETVGRCIAKARSFLARRGVSGEVLVADNGSTDESTAVAEAAGARIVRVRQRGYGSALIGGIRSARGTYVIMGDSDDSYDFAALDAFLDKLREGHDLVMGNRFRGGIRPGAMPPLHRYIGNPILSFVGRLFFHSPCGDFHCGLRGFNRQAILDLDLQTTGMEFASEMIVKATINRLRITDVPTILSPDGRDRPSHLRSWRDGWRHLRFLLLLCPSWLFLYPGLGLFLAGALVMALLLPAPRRVAGINFDIDTLFYASLAVVTGYQSMLFWLLSKIFATQEGILPRSSRFNSLVNVLTLEIGLIAGAVLLLIGLALASFALGLWRAENFGELLPGQVMRLVIPSGTAVLLAFQTVYSAFFMSVLELRPAPADEPSVSHSTGGDASTR